MKRNLPALLAVVFLGYAVVAAGQNISDPARIEVYVTPYYNSKGPTINVGPFSKGLGANTEPEFVATIARMKQSWDTLSFPETYVAAIRLYDLGFRKEAIYWFLFGPSTGVGCSLRWSTGIKWAASAIPGSNWCRQRMPSSSWWGPV